MTPEEERHARNASLARFWASVLLITAAGTFTAWAISELVAAL